VPHGPEPYVRRSSRVPAVPPVLTPWQSARWPEDVGFPLERGPWKYADGKAHRMRRSGRNVRYLLEQVTRRQKSTVRLVVRREQTPQAAMHNNNSR
jgi:hypothetical protein